MLFRLTLLTFADILERIIARLMKNNRLVDAVVSGLQEKKGRNIVIVNLSPIGDTICDYFVICTGNSPSHVQTLTRSVEEESMKRVGEKSVAVSGLKRSEWVAMDYADVIVHIMLQGERDFYDIEHLWADALIEQVKDID